MNEINGYYVCAVHPSHINGWYQSLTPLRSKLVGQFDEDELEAGKKLYRQRLAAYKKTMPSQFLDNSHHGKISKVARRKISRAVDYLTHIVPKQKYFHPGTGRSGDMILNFITLTLPSEQIHTDNEIKSDLLEPFLNTCRQKWKVSSYIWRMEKQKNGNTHFHLITDRFIWWNELRNMWNRHCERLGYVTRYRDNQIAWHKEGYIFNPAFSPKLSNARQYHNYKEGIACDWNNPNSTDVHGLRTIIDATSYLTKYITKTDQSDNIEGRLWGCSSNLTRIRGAEIFADGDASDEIDKLISDPRCKFYKGDYFFVITFNNKLLYCGTFPIIREELETFIRGHFPEYRPPSLKL